MAKRKKRAKSHRKNEITKGIFSVLESNPQKSFNYRQIAAKLKITDTEGRNLLIARLGQLKEKQRIEEAGRGKYKAVHTRTIHRGRIDLLPRGYAYVIVEGMEKDAVVPFGKLNRAFHGDEVEVYVYPRKNSKKQEAEVLRILKRKKDTFVGIAEVHKKFAFVRPTDSRMYTDFFIPLNNLGNAKHGEKVLVKMVEWPANADSPFGKITSVLGVPGEHQTEIHAILAEYGLPYEFPFEVEEFANKLDTGIKSEEISKRRDFRDILTFTIDPADAKDFDDALSFKILKNGNYEIGIHIADVSHYVHPDSVLEEEAYERATSVYLVDRVVPMLPEILSNQACSLRPNEEKYTFSAVFEIDKQASVINKWFGRTVINSDERFAYEEAQHVIETGGKEIPDNISIRGNSYSISENTRDAIITMDKLAKSMREGRMTSGAISFDKVEVKFKLNGENNPIGVYFKEAKDANKLIEEFMLLANREVARFIGRSKTPKTFIYRIHDEPNEDKLMALNGIISRFGHTLDLRNKKTTTESLNKLLEDVQGKKEQNLVDTLAIRSMSKAIYTTENIGHYGLSFDYYTHFTSPIRRYPDIMVHRLLQRYLDGGKSANTELFEEASKHSSDMEVLAANAERDSIKYMQIKYMQDHLDVEFLGVISGVTEWGIYVEIIENKCEGMVRIRDLKDDYYTFDESLYALVGEKSKNMYQLGEEVVVMVKKTDLIKRHLDFTLLRKSSKKLS
ncbi:MAG: ribonuclease R [Flavobacteriaceae bacterium]